MATKRKRKTRRGLRGVEEQRELRLYLDNDSKLYRFKQAVRANLAKHVCRGKFSHNQAAKGFKRLTDEAAKGYGKEFDTGAAAGLRVFSPADRKRVSKDLVKEFVRDVRNFRKGRAADLSSEEQKNLTSCPRARRAR